MKAPDEIQDRSERVIPGQSQPTQRHSTGRHPPLPKEQGIDDQRLDDNARPSQTTVTSQDAANGHVLEKSENRQVYPQAHVQLWEEKHRLGFPQKSSRKPDSASPDNEKKDQEKETSPWDASSNVCRSHR